jgi:hypothetical protein
MRRWAGAVLVLIAAATATSGCGTPPPSTSPAASRAAPGPSATPSSSASETRVDATLLAILPPEIGGVELTADEATAVGVVSDPALGVSVEGLAVAAAFGPIATDTTLDYVVVTLARLRPGVFGDGFFRDWRDSFDGAVCEQAGGVDGHAEAVIAGRQTFIGTCAGGVRTYHVYLPTWNVVVSMQGSGDGRFGERVVEGLRE